MPSQIDEKQSEIVKSIAAEVRSRQLGEGSGHDWSHTNRVWNLALLMAEREGSVVYIVSLAALLHDIGDWKLFTGGEAAGQAEVRNIMVEAGVDADSINHVLTIISEISFYGGGTPRPMSTLEGKIVQDADRLDAIGAIGIARCFAYGGSRDRLIYDPDITPRTDLNKAEYKANKGDSINHFHEKLMLLKDLMNTSTGRSMAEQRHAVMERFLADFMNEWNEAQSHATDADVNLA